MRRAIYLGAMRAVTKHSFVTEDRPVTKKGYRLVYTHEWGIRGGKKRGANQRLCFECDKPLTVKDRSLEYCEKHLIEREQRRIGHVDGVLDRRTTG